VHRTTWWSSPGVTATGAPENQRSSDTPAPKPDGTYGDPAVRNQGVGSTRLRNLRLHLRQHVRAGAGSYRQPDHAGAWPQCSQPTVRCRLRTSRGLQPNCTVTDIVKDDTGATTETPDPTCAAPRAPSLLARRNQCGGVRGPARQHPHQIFSAAPRLRPTSRRRSPAPSASPATPAPAAATRTARGNTLLPPDNSRVPRPRPYLVIESALEGIL